MLELAAEGRVAAVVIIDRVVEPGRNLDVALGRRNAHGVGVIRIAKPREVGSAAVFLTGEPGVDGCAVDASAALVRIVGDAAIGTVELVAALGELDDVGGVVDDDVHVELHAARVHGVDQRLEVRVGPEVRVDLREVGDPVAVIAGAFVARRPLNCLVLEDRRNPDGRRTKPLDIVEALHQALEVAAVVEALRGRIEAGHQATSRQPATVVRGIAVLEAVRQNEIDDFVLRQARAIVGDLRRSRADASHRPTGANGRQRGDRERFADALSASRHCHSFSLPTRSDTNCRWVGRASALTR